MSASPPFYTQRPRDSLSFLEVCQEDLFGNELKQVDKDLVATLDPVVHLCLSYSSPQAQVDKSYKSYDTDKGRFVCLSAHARPQKGDGYLELSRQELITILFLMALYRPDKEGRSSEPTADPVETCSASEQSSYDSPQPFTTDCIMNRCDPNSENLVEEIRHEISLIKDNLNKYFTAEFDAGSDHFFYYNKLLTGQDYTDPTVFCNLMPKITTKTKPTPTKCAQGKSKSRSTRTKRRKTITQTPVSPRLTAPHLASAENQHFREIPTEPAVVNNGNLATSQQYPTPSYDQDYQMAQYATTDFVPERNFQQIQPVGQAFHNFANQGVPSAYATFNDNEPDYLYHTIKKLIDIFEKSTGRKYLDVHNAYVQNQEFVSQTDLMMMSDNVMELQHQDVNFNAHSGNAHQMPVAFPQTGFLNSAGYNAHPNTSG